MVPEMTDPNSNLNRNIKRVARVSSRVEGHRSREFWDFFSHGSIEIGILTYILVYRYNLNDRKNATKYST